MGIDDVGVDPVEERKFLKLARDAAAGDPVAMAVCEEEAAGPLLSVDPVQRFLLEEALGYRCGGACRLLSDINVAASDMLDFKLDEFMDPGAGGGEKSS